MSMQERWVVYPLLFMAIALGLRDDVIDPESKFVDLECQELTITNVQGDPILRAGSTLEDTASLVLYHSVGPVGELPTGLDQGDEQRHAMEFGEDQAGGYIKISGASHLPILKLAHIDSLELSGLIAVDEGDRPIQIGDDDESPIWGEVFPWKFVRPEAEISASEIPVEIADSVPSESLKSDSSGDGNAVSP